jgi:hypothetical protein
LELAATLENFTLCGGKNIDGSTQFKLPEEKNKMLRPTEDFPRTGPIVNQTSSCEDQVRYLMVCCLSQKTGWGAFIPLYDVWSLVVVFSSAEKLSSSVSL